MTKRQRRICVVSQLQTLQAENERLTRELEEAKERIRRGADEEYAICDILKAQGVSDDCTLPEGVERLALEAKRMAEAESHLQALRAALEQVQPILDELARAEAKFPTWPTDVIHAATVVSEESGELAQAALQWTYEGGSLEAVRTEAIQTGAMALRFLLHLPAAVTRPSEQLALSSTRQDAPKSCTTRAGEAIGPQNELVDLPPASARPAPPSGAGEEQRNVHDADSGRRA